jgi:aprataxin
MILRKLAQMSKPETLPVSVLFTHTPTSITIFDAFPKSIFHFLILPRLVPPSSVSELSNLRALLKSDKARAKDVLLGLREDANAVKRMIEDEMVSRYGFKWGVLAGFHAVPSME